MNRSSRQKLFEEVDLYPVTCAGLSAGRTNLEVVEAVISGGARIVQYREKNLPDGERFRQALAMRKLTARTGALLIINDRIDIALASGADGVHLGQGDLPVAAARQLAPELLIGASTHSLDDACTAQAAGADYVNIGPIFPTTTKEGLQDFLGPEAVAEIGPRLNVPFTVMGGITAGNMREVLARGARRIAVVTAVTEAPDIAGAVRELRETILGFHQ
jgi:thiamine-phosphate pyrophosphorylase